MSVVASVTQMNRTVLLAMHELALRDPVYASAKFNMAPEDLQAFVSFPVDALERFAQCCDTPLFAPTVDVHQLAKLVTTPAPVAALILSSRSGVAAGSHRTSHHG